MESQCLKLLAPFPFSFGCCTYGPFVWSDYLRHLSLAAWVHALVLPEEIIRTTWTPKKAKKPNNLPCSLRNAMLNLFKTSIKYDSKKSMHTPFHRSHCKFRWKWPKASETSVVNKFLHCCFSLCLSTSTKWQFCTKTDTSELGEMSHSHPIPAGDFVVFPR